MARSSRTRSPRLYKRRIRGRVDLRNTIDQLSSGFQTAVSAQDEDGKRRTVRLNLRSGTWEYRRKKAWHSLSGLNPSRTTAAQKLYLTSRSTGDDIIGGADHLREHELLSVADHVDVETYLNQALLITSSPTFANVAITTLLQILEGGVSPQFFTKFQGGDQAADINYTLPALLLDGSLQNVGGVMHWGPAGSGTPTGTYIVSGGNVTWISDYTYRVGAASYYIDGILYASAEGQITLDAAHATLDRIDVIALDTNGAIVKITGTAASDPSYPDIDTTLYVEATWVLVTANTTVPPGVVSTVIYAEGIEWTETASAGTIVMDSANNPRSGSVCIEGTAVVAGTYAQFVAAAPFYLTGQNNLIFYIRQKAAFATTKTISVRWYNSGTARGNTILIGNGMYGFDKSNITSYQQIVIPMAAFNVGPTLTVDRLRISTAGSGAAVGFYMDDISMETGTTPGVGEDYVKGPASAVNGRIAIFSGTSGKLIADSGYGLGTPADTQVIYNDGGVTFAGDADFTWNKTTNKLTLAGGLITPLIESPAATDLRLLPPSGKAVLIGAGGGAAGSFRPFVWGDNPTVVDNVGIYLAAQIPTGTGLYPAGLLTAFTFNVSDATKGGRSIAGVATLPTGKSLSWLYGFVGHATVEGTAAIATRMAGVTCIVNLGADYSGTVPKAYGAYVDLRFSAGTATELIGFGMLDPAVTGGTATTLIGFDIPALTKGTLNYGLRLGANTHLLNGNQVWLFGDNYTNEIQSESTLTGAHLQFRRAGASAATTILLRNYISRGTLASPSAIQNNDGAAYQLFGYGDTAWSSSARASIRLLATETWTDTAQGTSIRFDTIATGGVVGSSPLLITSAALTLADAVNMVFNTTTGTKLGTATTQKIGAYNATPVIQPASANQAALTNSTGGTTDGTLSAVPSTNLAAAVAVCNNNFAELHVLLDAIRTALVNTGWIKGAA